MHYAEIHTGIELNNRSALKRGKIYFDFHHLIREFATTGNTTNYHTIRTVKTDKQINKQTKTVKTNCSISDNIDIPNICINAHCPGLVQASH